LNQQSRSGKNVVIARRKEKLEREREVKRKKLKENSKSITTIDDDLDDFSFSNVLLADPISKLKSHFKPEISPLVSQTYL